jgi:arginine decarboxylase
MPYKEYRNITDILNYQTKKTIRWCTPSIIPSAAKILDFYSSDISISYHMLGYPTDPSGVFKKAYQKAAKAYGADHSLFSVNGSSGSNFVVFRTLSKQIPNAKILAQRNIHQSALAACEDYLLNLDFIPARVDDKLNIFVPNTVDEIIYHILLYEPDVLFLTNPTYEGFVLDLEQLVSRVRKIDPKIIIFVDEAWGAHLHFSNKLPMSAMSSGVDICVQSTHKQGGALQQTSMIHLKRGRINEQLLLTSYRHLMTTSPSFTLLASLDAAREAMEKHGVKLINRSIEIADYLSQGISLIPNLNVVSLDSIQYKNNSIAGKDYTKVIIDVSETGISGYEITHELESSYGIITEMNNVNMILLLVPFQATFHDAQITVEAFTSIIHHKNKDKHSLIFPKIPSDAQKLMSLSEFTSLNNDRIELIPLDEAKGRIAAESIVPYPPGIPITVKGDEFTDEIVNFYTKFRNQNYLKVNAYDGKLKNVLVVK